MVETITVSDAVIKMKQDLWHERAIIFSTITCIWAFILGIGIAHYFPEYLEWLW